MANPSPARFDEGAKLRLRIVVLACLGPSIVLTALCICYALGTHVDDVRQRLIMGAVLLVAAVGCVGSAVFLGRRARDPHMRASHSWLCRTGSALALYSLGVLAAFAMVTSLVLSHG